MRLPKAPFTSSVSTCTGLCPTMSTTRPATNSATVKFSAGRTTRSIQRGSSLPALIGAP
jgi:hypothetical protein